MTNSEKYGSAEERAKAFRKFCRGFGDSCDGCKVSDFSDGIVERCAFSWLDLDVEYEKPLPCPSCGNRSVFIVHDKTSPMPWSVKCSCGYSSARTPDKELTIAAHNRVARAVMAAKESEVK